MPPDEDGQETGLQQQHVPLVRHEILPGVDQREIEDVADDERDAPALPTNTTIADAAPSTQTSLRNESLEFSQNTIGRMRQRELWSTSAARGRKDARGRMPCSPISPMACMPKETKA